MTAAITAANPAYGLRDVARMEWCKLRTVRSTGWLLLLFAAGMIALAAVVGATGPVHADPSFDPTEELFAGLSLGQLLVGVLGVLTLSSEFGTGSIRATFTAVPRRGYVLAAKAVVTGAVALIAGELLAFAALAAFLLAAKSGVPHPSLAQPGVLRAVLMAGAYPALIGLIGLGLAAVIRRTAGAIAAVAGVTFLLPLLFLPLGEHSPVLKFLPEVIAENSLTAVKPVADSLSPAVGFALLGLYAAVALAAGGWALARRDA
jgi:ABC-2 type transport system permease protein